MDKKRSRSPSTTIPITVPFLRNKMIAIKKRKMEGKEKKRNKPMRKKRILKVNILVVSLSVRPKAKVLLVR